MSTFVFSVYILSATGLVTASYILLMALLKKEIDQSWSHLQMLITLLASTVILITSAVFGEPMVLDVTLIPIVLQVILFIVSVLAYFTMRPKSWALDSAIVDKLKMATYTIFTISTINWIMIVVLLAFIPS